MLTYIEESPVPCESIYGYSDEYRELFQKQQDVEAKRIALTAEESEILLSLKRWVPSGGDTNDRMSALEKVMAGERLSSSPSAEKRHELSGRLTEVRKALNAIQYAQPGITERLALLRHRATTQRMREQDASAVRAELAVALHTFMAAHEKASKFAAQLTTAGFNTQIYEQGWWLAPELGQFKGEAGRWLKAG